MTESAASAAPPSASPPAPARRAATILQAGTGREPHRAGARVPTSAITELRCTDRAFAR
ncbi:hypothetical protein ACFY71_36870 [Streptomyces cinerochromogenes]|uniref:hypothetical protein n=1 Tax=Streptomyces cinerochromogenes TaxID=66422 RepID=UPI00368C1473